MTKITIDNLVNELGFERIEPQTRTSAYFEVNIILWLSFEVYKDTDREDFKIGLDRNYIELNHIKTIQQVKDLIKLLTPPE